MRLVISGLSLVAAVMLLAASASAADGPFYIHGTRVNLRAEPEGEILLELDVNDKVFVIERKGEWSLVSAPGRGERGWVFSSYIGEGKLAVEPAAESAGSASADSAPVTAVKSAAATASPAVQDEKVVVEDIEIVDSGSMVVASYTPPEKLPAPPEESPAGRVSEGFLADGADTPASTAEMAAAPANETTPAAADTTPPAAIDTTPPAADSKVVASAKPTGWVQDRYTPTPDTVRNEAPAMRPAEEPEQAQAVQTPAPADATAVQVVAAAASESDAVEVEFYQPLTPRSDITIPAALGDDYYAVGGNNIALISGTDVNVRGEGSTKAAVVGRANDGDKCYLIGEHEGWCYVSIPGKNIKGWVRADYVELLPRIEITGDDVRLREQPDTEARIKAELSRGDVFFKFDEMGKWIKVASSSSGLKGWVFKQYTAQTAREPSRPYKVTGDDVNFRVSPAVDSDIITALPQGTTVQVLGRNEKWSFLEYNGQRGWMYSQYLDPNFRGAPKEVYGKSIGGRLIARAKAMTGTPYVWGGESDSGVDCSGLIYKLLLEEGADASGLPRRASTQMAQLGQEVDKESLAPGDLVFFTTYKEGASHVGIYLGDGDFIHASSAQGKVAISNMSEGYYKRRFVGARRITETELRGMQ